MRAGQRQGAEEDRRSLCYGFYRVVNKAGQKQLKPPCTRGCLGPPAVREASPISTMSLAEWSDPGGQGVGVGAGP